MVLFQELATSKRLSVVLAPSESFAQRTSAQRVVRTSVESRNGRLVLKATVTELKTQKDVDSFSVEGNATQSFIEVATNLAKKLASDAGPFSTPSDYALKDFVGAFSARGHKQAESLATAIHDDPNFGLAYITFLEAVVKQDPKFAQNLARDAQMHRNRFTPLDGARFDLLMRRLSGAPPKQLAESVSAVLALAPHEIGSLIALAQLKLADNKTTEAISTLHDALDVDPANLQARQLLAAAFVNTNRDDDAVHTLEELRALRPEDPMTLSSLGELQFSIGRFADAAKTFSGLTDPSGHLLSAVSKALDGDSGGAEAEFEKFASSRGSDPSMPLSRAAWLALTGKREQAVETLTRATYPSPDFKSLALSEAAVLQATAHNPAAASQLAEEATKLAGQPLPKIYATVANLMAHAYDSQQQIATAFASSGMDPAAQVVASGLVYYAGGHYDLSLSAWQKELASNPADVRAQILRSACLFRLGRLEETMKEAPRLLMPNLNGQDPFAVYVFGEMLKVRAAISHKDGHAVLAAKLDKAVSTFKL